MALPEKVQPTFIKFDPNFIKFRLNFIKSPVNLQKFSPNLHNSSVNFIKSLVNLQKFSPNLHNSSVNFYKFSPNFIKVDQTLFNILDDFLIIASPSGHHQEKKKTILKPITMIFSLPYLIFINFAAMKRKEKPVIGKSSKMVIDNLSALV